jgi:serine/threonine protein kinase
MGQLLCASVPACARATYAYRVTWQCVQKKANSSSDSHAVAASPLQAVRDIHDLRIVHSDLKPANFLMVEGQLKLIDFGIAKAISNDTTSIARESQVRTGTQRNLVPACCCARSADATPRHHTTACY